MRRLPSVLALVVLAISTTSSVPAPAADAPYEKRERLILEPQSSETILTLEGRYPKKEDTCPSKQPRPLRAKFRGRLELARADDGSIQIVNQLSFSNYLRGVAEVPFSWPEAALRAQVIAARSYALATQRDERKRAGTRGYDICATVLCQVYRGAHVELGAFGERWVDAVESTRGKALTYRDGVIKAFYFSTSTGRTRSSFSGGSGPAWLPSVDGEDADAPLARWTARIRMRDLGPILRAAGRWPGGAITRVAQDGQQVRVSGGTSRNMSKNDFRIALNNEAPCFDPDRYPTKGSATGTKLPQTIPSATFTLAQDDDTVVVRGRGWGHDVGMSQFGARSLAERGRSTSQILAHYYGPARIETVKEPESIRVLAAEGLRRVSLSFDGPVRVRTGTGSLLRTDERLEVRGGGKTLRVSRGRGPTLQAVLDVRPTVVRLDALPGATIAVPFETSRPIRATAELRAQGKLLQSTGERSFESGERTVDIPLVDDAGVALPVGRYEAVIEAYDGLDRIRTVPVAVTIAAPSPTPSPTPAPTPANRALPLGFGVLLAALAAGAWWWARARRATRT